MDFHKLGAILLLNAPEDMEFGIDNQYWKIGPKFKGVKLVPHGAHFVYYSLPNEHFQARQGFWIFIKPNSQYMVKRFSEKLEKFVELEDQ